eukprot:3007095-Rhodomonas_salina.1
MPARTELSTGQGHGHCFGYHHLCILLSCSNLCLTMVSKCSPGTDKSSEALAEFGTARERRCPGLHL